MVLWESQLALPLPPQAQVPPLMGVQPRRPQLTACLLWELGTPRQGNILGHVSWGLAGRGSPSLLLRGRLEPSLVSRRFGVSGF